MSEQPESLEQPTLTDWVARRDHVDAAQDQLAHEWQPTATEKQAILRARAKQLAIEPASSEASEAPLVLAQFRLGKETYGIDLSAVREVYPLKELTPLPGTPPFMLGIINYRGQILSIVDLRQLLDLPLSALPEADKVLIIHDNKLEFGIAVDSVLGVRIAQAGDLQPPPAAQSGSRASYMQGVTADHLIVLSASRLLNDPDLIVNDELSGQPT